MLTEAKNQLLTRVGPRTKMGDLLRRYWHPIAGVGEFDNNPIKPIRLFGEDLVLYKDLSGCYGLIARQCPHRRADLAHGWVEGNGIRCNYHGWLMNEKGACIEQPYEDIANPSPHSKDRCGTDAYPVRELAGMLWAYMGPHPAPELPVWEPFNWRNGFAEVVICEVPCNWFQCQENSCDPVHFEWMHDNWSNVQKGSSVRAAKHLKVEFEEFDYGFVYKRVREGAGETDETWTVGRVTLWPNGFFLGDHFEWRVPIDDDNTLSISWFFTRVPTESEPYVQDKIPTWHAPIKDEQGRWITSHVMNQDIVAWVGQGVIADRSKENLRSSDRGIVLIRQRFFDEMDRVEKGHEPKGIIRDPALAKNVELPTIMKKIFVEGIPLKDFEKYPVLKARLTDFRWHAGQPKEIRRAFEQAIGITAR